MLTSRPFYAPTVTELTDLSVVLLDEEVVPAAVLAQPDLALETVPVDTGWVRLTGLYDGPKARTLIVRLANDTVVLEQHWDSTHADTDLLALFQAEAGTVPVTFHAVDQLAAPLAGVQVSVWDGATPVIPLVQTSGAGAVTVALPPGEYQVYWFRAYTAFSGLPDTLTVVADVPQTLNKVGTISYPQLPTMPKVTLYGWVLKVDGTPVPGAEVRITALTPGTLRHGGAGIYRFEVTTVTDASGHFVLTPIASTEVLLTCPAVGYSRKGTLPASGVLNWSEFALAELV